MPSSRSEPIESPCGSKASLASTPKARASGVNTSSTQASPVSRHTTCPHRQSAHEPSYNVPQPLVARLFGNQGSPSSLSSLERRACRICQSETGTMVRPCGCAGTMGDIHEACLSRWVTASRHKDRCEICHEDYALSGSVFKSFRKWSWPKFELSDLLAVGTFLGLIGSILYLLALISERLFIERVFVQNMPIRSDDYARILLTIVMFVLGGGMVALFFSQIVAYIGRQKEIRFVNKYDRDGATAANGM